MNCNKRTPATICNTIDICAHNNQTKTVLISQLDSAIFTYKHMICENEAIRLRLLEFLEHVCDYTASIDAANLIKTQYDAVIYQYYMNLNNWVSSNYRDDGGILHPALLSILNNENTKNMIYTYMTCNGAIVNNSVAILDNVLLQYTDTYLIVQIGAKTYNIPRYDAFVNTDIANIKITVEEIRCMITTMTNKLNQNIYIINKSMHMINTIHDSVNDMMC